MRFQNQLETDAIYSDRRGEHIEFSHIIGVICCYCLSEGPLSPMESELLWQRVESAPAILQAHFQSSPWDVSRREWPLYLSR